MMIALLYIHCELLLNDVMNETSNFKLKNYFFLQQRTLKLGDINKVSCNTSISTYICTDKEDK